MVVTDETRLVSKTTNGTQASEVQSERIDDIPLLLHLLQKMGVPEQIDKAYTPHQNWQGLSLGWVTTVWLAYILTECDHRMNQVRDWVKGRLYALSNLIGQEIRETDFTDDRLAEVLRYLSVNATFNKVEENISQRTIRVYNLELGQIRLDATVGQVYHDPEQHTLFQVGRTKDGTYSPQFKVMLGALDPMGLPLAVDVVSGEQADDPLYLPVYWRIRRTLGLSGLLYVGDAKMGAIETRARIQAGEDYYLMPLALVGETPEFLSSLLNRLFADEFETQRVYLPEACDSDPSPRRVDGSATNPELAVAEGFEVTIERTAKIDGQMITWTERIFCVKSFTYACAERKGLENRLAHAQAALQALTPPPGRGRKQYVEETALQVAIDQILERYNVKGLLFVTLERKETQRQIRAYGGRPARTETQVRFSVDVVPNTVAIALASQRLGWRLYATNAPVERLALSQAVRAYREQYLAERDFARLHGRHLGITPLYVQRDDHALGLIRLLTLALRAMVMIQFLARRKLAKQNATLSGIYAGNPIRATARYFRERLLATFKEITLTTIRLCNNRFCRHLTPLLPVQETILALLDIPVAVYTDLVRGLVTVT